MKSFSEYNPITVALWYAAVILPAMFILHPALTALSIVGSVLLHTVRTKSLRGNLIYFILFFAIALLNPFFYHNGVTILFFVNDNPITLEALLYTPVSDGDLFLAKVLTALLPAMVIGVASFAAMAVAVNAAGYSLMGGLFFPAPPWWPMVFWLGPAVSLLGLGATVLFSARAKTFMQAQQTSGMLVLPIVLLMVGQVSGLLFLGVGVMLVLGLVVFAVGALLVWIGARTFSRGELIARV